MDKFSLRNSSSSKIVKIISQTIISTYHDRTILFVYRHRLPGGEKEKKSSVSIIQTKPSETKEKVVPAIQPSKTYKTNSEEETKKQIKGTKVVVNSVIEQNVINSSEDNGLKTVKNQVRLMIFFVNIK